VDIQRSREEALINLAASPDISDLPDLKAGDFERMMTVIPEPWVEHKAYPLSSYTKHKHPANPTGLDEDDLLSHKVPAEALKTPS
jgi:hypothetical protein